MTGRDRTRRQSPPAPGGRLEARLDQARIYFRHHYAGVEPDAGFPGRVAARLPGEPSELLGWAALRLLPVSLALILVLALLSTRVAPETETLAAAAGSEDPIGWVLEGAELEP